MRASLLPSFGFATLGLVLAACGSRSSLSLATDPGAAGTDGGGATGGTTGTATGGTATTSTITSTSTTTTTTTSTTTITSTSTGGGGTGGTGVCTGLTVDGPPVSPFWGPAGNQQHTPTLARTSEDGASAGLVYVEDSTDPDDIFHVASVALEDPWGVWPDSLGTSAYHDDTIGLAAGPDHDGHFSLVTVVTRPGTGEPLGTSLFSTPPGVSGAQWVYSLDGPAVPRLVTTNGEHYLTGLEELLPENVHRLWLHRISAEAGAELSSGVLACSKNVGLSVAAIRLGTGFLVAQSNGRPFATCLSDEEPDLPPSRLQIVILPDDVSTGILSFENDEPASHVLQVQIVPAPDGAWVAWERINAQAAFERHIQVLELDQNGFPKNGNIIDLEWGEPGTPFAIAALGHRFALASADVMQGTVSVRLYAADGAFLADVTLPQSAAFMPDPSAALLASPAADHLLVAWSESSAINNDDRRVAVARIGCIDP